MGTTQGFKKHTHLRKSLASADMGTTQGFANTHHTTEKGSHWHLLTWSQPKGLPTYTTPKKKPMVKESFASPQGMHEITQA